MDEADAERLRDMVEAARKAVLYTQGKSRGDLDTDELLALGLVRLLEIVGEAARSVSGNTRELHRNVPWREIVKTRDRLIHGYSTVDLDIVWEIIRDDLPLLIAELEAILLRESP